MDLEPNIFAVEIIRIGRVGGRKPAVAAEHGGPAFAASARRVAQAALILAAADDHRRIRVACPAIKLSNAQVVVQFLPAARQADVVNIGRAIDAAVVPKVNRSNSRAVESWMS